MQDIFVYEDKKIYLRCPNCKVVRRTKFFYKNELNSYPDKSGMRRIIFPCCRDIKVRVFKEEKIEDSIRKALCPLKDLILLKCSNVNFC